MDWKGKTNEQTKISKTPGKWKSHGLQKRLFYKSIQKTTKGSSEEL